MSTQLVSAFENTKVTGVTQHEQTTANSEAVKNGTGTLEVGQKLHLDCTPVDMAGVPYPGYSEIIKNFKRVTGPNPNAPAIQWRWGSNRQEFSNSGNDPFHLGSYEPDGCTPSLKLERQVGEGSNEIWAEPFIEAGDNGGVAVVGPRCTFRAD